MSEYGKLTYKELEDYSIMQSALLRKKSNKIEQLQARVTELEEELNTARADWQEKIAKVAAQFPGAFGS